MTALPAGLFVYLSSDCLSTRLSDCLSICLSDYFVYPLSDCLITRLPECLSVSLTICLPVCLTVCLLCVPASATFVCLGFDGIVLFLQALFSHCLKAP